MCVVSSTLVLVFRTDGGGREAMKKVALVALAPTVFLNAPCSVFCFARGKETISLATLSHPHNRSLIHPAAMSATPPPPYWGDPPPTNAAVGDPTPPNDTGGRDAAVGDPTPPNDTGGRDAPVAVVGGGKEGKGAGEVKVGGGGVVATPPPPAAAAAAAAAAA